jgi:hypothetical protein
MNYLTLVPYHYIEEEELLPSKVLGREKEVALKLEMVIMIKRQYFYITFSR